MAALALDGSCAPLACLACWSSCSLRLLRLRCWPARLGQLVRDGLYALYAPCFLRCSALRSLLSAVCLLVRCVVLLLSVFFLFSKLDALATNVWAPLYLRIDGGSWNLALRRQRLCHCADIVCFWNSSTALTASSPSTISLASFPNHPSDISSFRTFSTLVISFE